MIEIRETFRIHPDQMKEARELVIEHHRIAEKYDMQIKTLTDLAAEFYTIIFNVEASSFEEYLSKGEKAHATEEWKNWYIRFRSCVIEGRRELFTVII